MRQNCTWDYIWCFWFAMQHHLNAGDMFMIMLIWVLRQNHVLYYILNTVRVRVFQYIHFEGISYYYFWLHFELKHSHMGTLSIIYVSFCILLTNCFRFISAIGNLHAKIFQICSSYWDFSLWWPQISILCPSYRGFPFIESFHIAKSYWKRPGPRTSGRLMGMSVLQRCLLRESQL